VRFVDGLRKKIEIVSDPDSPHLDDPSDAGGSEVFTEMLGKVHATRVLSPDNPIFRSRGALSRNAFRVVLRVMTTHKKLV
jgi:hypothetical protein